LNTVGIKDIAVASWRVWLSQWRDDYSNWDTV